MANKTAIARSRAGTPLVSTTSANGLKSSKQIAAVTVRGTPPRQEMRRRVNCLLLISQASSASPKITAAMWTSMPKSLTGSSRVSSAQAGAPTKPGVPSTLATLASVCRSGLTNVRPKMPWTNPERADHCGSVSVASRRKNPAGRPISNSLSRRRKTNRRSRIDMTNMISPKTATTR